jgi:hypothetical protein
MRSTVLVSFEAEDAAQCVDIFEREDGTFGFEQFRREFDGASRWQSLSKYSQLSFASGEEALRSARQRVPWLDPTEAWRW